MYCKDQLVDAKTSLKSIVSRKRSREQWHDDYLEMEKICFESSTNELDARAQSSPDALAKELKTIIAIRDKLEVKFIRGYGRMHTTLWRLKKVIGKATLCSQASGPYEENAEYYKYGLLELMYQLSFLIHNREACFDEMVGAVKTVLEGSHKSADLLHLKAIEIYYRISNLGQSDGKHYGKVEERKAIQKWLKDIHRGDEYTEEYIIIHSELTVGDLDGYKAISQRYIQR